MSRRGALNAARPTPGSRGDRCTPTRLEQFPRRRGARPLAAHSDFLPPAATTALTLDLIALAGGHRLVLASAAAADAPVAARESAWLRQAHAVAADWLWAIDGDLATMAMVAPHDDRAGRRELRPCTFDLPGQCAEVAQTAKKAGELAVVLLRRLPFRKTPLPADPWGWPASLRPAQRAPGS